MLNILAQLRAAELPVHSHELQYIFIQRWALIAAK